MVVQSIEAVLLNGMATDNSEGNFKMGDAIVQSQRYGVRSLRRWFSVKDNGYFYTPRLPSAQRKGSIDAQRNPIEAGGD